MTFSLLLPALEKEWRLPGFSLLRINSVHVGRKEEKKEEEGGTRNLSSLPARNRISRCLQRHKGKV